MKINQESFEYLKKFIKSIKFSKKVTLTQLNVAQAIQILIENLEYQDKNYIEIIKEIYKKEK